MTRERPIEVKSAHLARKAVLYIRQSTEEQVQVNTGSTEYQRGQARYPIQWGWAAEQVEIIEDLGLSGSAADHRPGYQRLLAGIALDEIGIIVTSDITRIGRDATELFRLFGLCRRHEVLFAVDGRIHDTADNAKLLYMRLMATVGEHDNLSRRDHFQHGRIAKAAAGHAVSRPPRGYVATNNGSWIKDPEPAVRVAIDAIFTEFLRQRTCKQTVAALRARGVKLPRRLGPYQVVWRDIEVAQLYQMLRHPAYDGSYAFRQRVTDTRRDPDQRGHLPLRRARPEEIILVPDHHEAYVTPTVWKDIQDILHTHANSPRHQCLGPGSGLLQGQIRCALHANRAMSTAYKAPLTDGRRPHAYFCLGDYFFGGPQCGRIPGHLIDATVRAAVFERLSPPRIAVIREAFEEAQRAEYSEHQRHAFELQHARQRHLDLEQRYFGVDPANTLVARALEAKWEAAAREVQQLERLAEAGKSAPSLLDQLAFDDLVTLCGDLEAIWEAPTTAHRDRKEIIRTIVHEVRLEDRDEEHLRLRIIWADDEPDTLVNVARSGYARNTIAHLVKEGVDAAQIALRLNTMGILTRLGTPWTAPVIARRLQRLQRNRNV